MGLTLTRLLFALAAIILIVGGYFLGSPFPVDAVRTYPPGEDVELFAHCRKYMGVWQVNAFTLPPSELPFIYVDPCCGAFCL